MKQQTNKKRFSVAKLKAIARGELSITALFNTQPVIIATHLSNGEVNAMGQVYTSEQWQQIVKELEGNEDQTILSFHHMGFKKEDLVSSNSEAVKKAKKAPEPPKIIERYEKPQAKPQPSQAEIEEQERQARVSENRLQQEKILKIREDWNWHDVPFSNWINQLGRR